ncbi:MAG: folylpolyglutamate synthase/dihydrofolate synthase family protein [Candidatus Omnitrophota bacterium]|jgi:dihydrofolate synthase/folylpolyglutamate synthase|nr:bifunctional folylpolyglutamate synthase/dihydrofolate synthase [Candidatus Omnitrophota bacterium]MDD5517735.1 bifunctional folylpolyglutamate synthase/dihydrofolate synthase [Candidatus Omnitrophota bacterium]
MSYPEVIRYLESLSNYEIISRYPYQKAFQLGRIQGFLDLIANPESSLKCIHVAGSKGKGSTCAFLTYILREAGFKTGLYTSPHLADFRERIRILLPKPQSLKSSVDFEGMIPKAKLASLVNRLKPVIEKYNRTSKLGPLTFFEIYTALAFLYFQEEKVDFAVLETGLGGRLDATNVVVPLVSVITPVSYEHTDKLGRTLKKIASEKAGIIKNRKSAVISAAQKREALAVIRNKCKKLGAKLLVVGKDITYRGFAKRFMVRALYTDYRGLKIKLCGSHQVENACVALAAIEALRRHNIKVNIASLKGGLYNTLWPGRCEVVAKNPLVVLDGAQNAASSRVLKKAIKESFRYRRLILIFGVSNDKDIRGMADELGALADAVILTKSINPRAVEPATLKKYFPVKGKTVYITSSVREAKKLALRLAHKEDLILVTGSLFVVGESRNDKK